MENFSVADIMRLANSPAGQQLLSLLQQQDSAALKKAADHAKDGNYAGVQSTLAALLSDPEAGRLLSQLRGDQNE